MELLELVKKAEAEAEDVKDGNVELKILISRGAIKDYKLVKTMIIKDFKKDYTDSVFTWGTRSYFIVLNEYMKDSEKWTEVEIFKHNSDDCLKTVDVFNNAYETHEHIKTLCDEDVELVIKEGELKWEN